METLRLVRGVPTPAVPARVNHHGHGGGAPAHVCAAVGSRAGGGASAVEAVQAPAPAPASYVVQRPVRRLWPSSEEEAVEVEEEEVLPERRKGNWVMKILKVRSLWAEEEKKGLEMGDRCLGCGGDGESGGCDVAEEAEEEEEEKTAVFDRDSFSRLLRRVSLKEAQVFSRMSYLGSLAYDIPKIKPVNLLKYHGLRFVTSSLEKKAKPLNAEKERAPVKDREQNEEGSSGAEKVENQRREGYGITPSAAYQIAASAASYLQSQTKGILPSTAADKENLNDSTRGDGGNGMGAEVSSSEVASFVATTSSVTAVVAGKEEMKQAVAKGLNSVHSSPCEWYICDDDKSGARYFVIQGSETIASWQANLLFEPVQFEGFDVLVHRGIYEAAKGIYDQMLPQVRAHLKSHGSSATFRFTGHSLGGSLSLLISLMLLIRGEVPSSSLLPVISFGAPCIFCGGDYLLQKLGLPQTHVQAISMHRDIVPRAFSCSYPDHVAEILKAVNGNFRNHPCLKSQKLLYAPMGKLLILQPEEKFSPHHHLLPSGSGLYLLGNSKVSVKLLQAAQSAFLNSPHPLEMLSDRAAYGSEGTVSRDHDMSAYLRAMQAVVRQELKQMRRVKREQRRRIWWPLVASQSVRVDAITSHQGVLNDNYSQQHFTFSGILNGGKETLKRFQRLVASQHLHMVLVLFFPARWLLLGTLAVVNFR